jgi:4-oxalocrotonate tautomerase
VQVTVWSGMSLENKKKVVQGITKVFSDIGIPSQATTIVIEEIPRENWATGGKLHSETTLIPGPCQNSVQMGLCFFDLWFLNR